MIHLYVEELMSRSCWDDPHNPACSPVPFYLFVATLFIGAALLVWSATFL